MCFTEYMSWTMTAAGVGGGLFIYRYIPNMKFIAHVMFYFAIMEALQGLTYLVIDECSFWNKVLTALGGIHICFQPLVTSYMAAMEHEDPKMKAKFWFMCRLSVIGGLLMFFRVFFEVNGITKSVRHSCEYTPYEVEPLRGQEMCSVRGKYHMAWNFPAADVNYYFPSLNMHFFLSFAPFFAHPEDPVMIAKGLILILTGPLVGEYFSGPNRGEVAAIWCLYSVGHLFAAAMVHFFVVNKGKTGNEVEDVAEPKKVK